MIPGVAVRTHLDMPFGDTTSADDFESGTIAGGVRRPAGRGDVPAALAAAGLSPARDVWPTSPRTRLARWFGGLDIYYTYSIDALMDVHSLSRRRW